MSNDGSKTAGLFLIFVVSILFLVLSLVNYQFIVLMVVSLIIGLVLLLSSGEKAQGETSESTTWRTVSPSASRPNHRSASNTKSSFNYEPSDILLNGRYQTE